MIIYFSMMLIRFLFMFVLSLAVSLLFMFKLIFDNFDDIISLSLSAFPAVFYSDCGKDLQTIYKEIIGKAGVYRFTRKIAGDTYIGSAKK